ncbi:MAG: DUF433 domain-containing protein [Caldilineaceae bacterium]
MGNTRVTLDTVVEAFLGGATPEEISYQYTILNLADIYAVVGYYLHHQADVDAYLAQRRLDSAKIRAENEAHFSPEGTRARLLARRKTQES